MMEETMTQDIATRYHALKDGVGFARLDRGIIRLTGADRIDLLHRLSTADLARLAPGQVATTIVTSEKGRIVDLLDVVVRTDDLLLISSFSDPGATLAWIEKYVIMDDVEGEVIGEEFSLLGVYGDRAFQMVDAVIGTTGMPPSGSWVRGESEASEIMVWRGEGLNGPSSLHLLGNPTALDRVVSGLAGAGAVEIDPELMEIIRIEAGRPRADSELGLQHNPLELGLVSNVSFTKGCYIGQEVIARLDSYDKVKNRLVGLRVQAEEGGVVTPEYPVRSSADGDTVGRVTSVAHSPGIGTIALALLRATHATADTPVEVVDPESGDVVARGLISMLPFAT